MRAEARTRRTEASARRVLLNATMRSFYDGAGSGRRTDSFNSSNSSANAIWSSGDPMRLRNRARDVIRTSPHAANGARKIANKIVGAGITPRFVTSSPRARKMIAARWREFVQTVDTSGRLDFYSLQNLMARTIAEGGEGVLVWKWSRTAPYLTATLLEGDFLDGSKTDWRPDTSGLRTLQGIQMDSNGRRTGYWIFKEHPGEYFGLSNGYESVLANADDVDHVFDMLRPGQLRGISWFAPVLQKVRDLADYDDAELVRKRIEACFSVFVTQPGNPAGGPLLGGSTKDADNRSIEGLAPGLIKRINPGEDVKFAQPTSNDGYVDYLKAVLHSIAAGIGITYEQLTGDLEGVNYSSIRAGMIDFWELLDHWQWHMMVHQLCVPTEKRFLRMLELTGEKLPADLRVEWCPPARAYVDPQKDIAAIKEELKAGVRTYADVAASRGYDGNQVIEEVAAEQEQRRKLGVVVDIDITNTPKVAPPAAPPSADAADAEDPAPAKKKTE